MKRLLPLILVFVATGAYAAGDNWILDAARAVRQTDYRGVFVYLRGGRMDTLRITHRYRDGHEREHLVALSGEPREVVRKDGVAKCILPQRKVVLTTRHSQATLLSKVADITRSQLQQYAIRATGVKRLAGRTCRVVRIRPKDNYRYGYRLLIDEKTSLPLKFELIHDGQVLEQMMFTSIQYPDEIPNSELQQITDTKGFHRIRHVPKITRVTAQDRGDWQATWLPAGYHLAEKSIRASRSGHPVQQLLFTDGIATVSAFIAPVNVQHKFVGATRLGAVHAYGRTAGGSQITVVGEVPKITVRSIAEHIQLGQQDVASNASLPNAPTANKPSQANARTGHGSALK